MTNRLRTYLLVPAVLLCIIMTGAQAQTQAPVPTVQGWYDYCSASDPACLADLDQMHSGGFKLVVNYAVLYNSSASQVLAYADHAESLGMQIAWDLSDAAFFPNANPGPVANFPQFAATCGCSDTNSFITYYVNLVKNHPATWGYYVGDETDPSNASYVVKWSALVHQLDPNHPRLFVCLGDTILANEKAELDPFLAGADMIGDDFYPFGGPGTTVTDFANATANLQSIATQNGKQSVIVEQAMSWGEYPDSGWCTPYPSCEPFPTEAQMLQLRNLSLQKAQPTILLWYSYFDLWKYSSPNDSRTPAQLWANVVSAAFAGASTPTPTPTPKPTPTPTPTGCTPTAITPYLQVNGGSWLQASSATVAAGSTIGFGPQPVSGGSWSWSGPSGYSSTSRQISVTVQSTSTYTATYTNPSGCKSTQKFTITVTGGQAVVSLSSAFNATGIHSDGTAFTDTGFDGFGDACSSKLLGSSLTWSSATFSYGPADKPNTITAASNVISLPTGSFSSLKMIGSAVNGAQTSQSFKVTYSDGTTTTFKQSMSDWDTPASYSGESKAVTMSYVDANDGTNYTGPNYLYGYSFSLNNAKTVKSIQLPNNANVKIVAITLVP